MADLACDDVADLGAIEPPIKPDQDKIVADVPSQVKDDFKTWLRKPVPDGAQEAFGGDWTGKP